MEAKAHSSDKESLSWRNKIFFTLIIIGTREMSNKSMRDKSFRIFIWNYEFYPWILSLFQKLFKQLF